MTMITRQDFLDSALEKIKIHDNLALQAATSFGKSRVSIELVKYLQSETSDKLKVLIVVAERAHINNWKEELNKWKCSIEDINIICYASLKKVAFNCYDIVIYDEAHHLGTPIRLNIFSHIHSKYNIFLSATLKNELISTLETYCGRVESLKVGLQDALDSKVIAEPKIKLIPLELDNTKPYIGIKEEWGNAKKRIEMECLYSERWKYLRSKKYYPNATLIIKCTELQAYTYITEQYEYYKTKFMNTRNEIIKNKWLQYGSKRKRFLGTLKTQKALELIQTLKKKRFICFCTDINQAKQLGGDNAIHSQNKDSFKIIESFNNKERNNIFAVGMLQEGMNLKDIEVGIIVQLDGEERAFLQKTGRVLRSKHPVEYILYFKNTRDEEYLNKVLPLINRKYVTVVK